MGTNWKTTTLGILAIVVAVGNIAIKLLNGHPLDMNDFAILGVGGGGGLGLIHAQDVTPPK